MLIYGSDNSDGNHLTDMQRFKNNICNFSGDCDKYWNREHVYPKSLGTPNLGVEGAGSDAHALRACDTSMNTRRSNRKFSEGNGVAKITSNGYWYPGDEWKVDVSRMIMYMYLRYPSQTVANNVAVSSHNYHTDMPDIFLKWNKEDPVSQLEIQRNDYLETLQGNRNPFIDNPYIATLIWGGESAPDTWGVLSLPSMAISKVELFVYSNPTSDLLFYKANKKATKILIYDMMGKLIGVDYNLNDNKIEIPEIKGQYIVSLNFDDVVVTRKIIKE